MDSILLQLLTSIRSSIASTECRKVFDEAFKHSYSSLNVNQLVTGPTPSQRITFIENASTILLENCNDNEHSHNYSDAINQALWKALRKMADLTVCTNSEKIKSQVPNSGSPIKRQQDTVVTVSNNLSKVTLTPQLSSTPAKNTAVEKKEVKPPTDPTVVDTIYTQLEKFISENPLLFSRFKFVTCKSKHCVFCLNLFKGICLTPCIGHKSCIKSGWFPHLGIGLWKSLSKVHNLGKPYESRCKSRPNSLPSIQARVEHDSDAISLNYDTDSIVETMSEDWASEVEREEVLRTSQQHITSVTIGSKKRKSQTPERVISTRPEHGERTPRRH